MFDFVDWIEPLNPLPEFFGSFDESIEACFVYFDLLDFKFSDGEGEMFLGVALTPTLLISNKGSSF